MVVCTNRKLTKIPATFPSETTVLLLNSNEIKELASNAFTSCAGINTLNFSHNKISVLHPDSFKGLTSLRNLFLDHNQIVLPKEDTRLFWDLLQLRVLKLNGNWKNLTHNPGILFSNLTQLTDLNIDSVGVPDDFPQEYSALKKLNKLTIFGGLQQISNNTFQAFRLLDVRELRIIGGLLTDVQSRAFDHFTNLTLLDLSYIFMLGFHGASKA